MDGSGNRPERLKIGDIWNGWRVDSFLGEGSFGEVYRIVRVEFGHTYESALKVIRIPHDNSMVESLRNTGMDGRGVTAYFRGMVDEIVKELILMSELKGNSNIVSYEDHSVVERKDGFGWIIFLRMELLTPFWAHIRTKSFTAADVIRLAVDMCKALEICRKNNIIHRDIKPENIFVSRQGDYKLGDFGIARQLGKAYSELSQKGTLLYMAPEVYRGHNYDHTVDIYSLGIVMYRLLNNNRLPFLPPYPQPISYASSQQSMSRRINGEPIPASANADAVLSNIVLKACAFNPQARYREPKDMRLALEAYAASMGIDITERTSPDIRANQYVNPQMQGSSQSISQAQGHSQSFAQAQSISQVQNIAQSRNQSQVPPQFQQSRSQSQVPPQPQQSQNQSQVPPQPQTQVPPQGVPQGTGNIQVANNTSEAAKPKAKSGGMSKGVKAAIGAAAVLVIAIVVYAMIPKLDYIRAVYNGSTDAYTVITNDSDITVNAFYNNGDIKPVSDWTLEQSVTLSPGNNAVTVKYKDETYYIEILSPVFDDGVFIGTDEQIISSMNECLYNDLEDYVKLSKSETENSVYIYDGYEGMEAGVIFYDNLTASVGTEAGQIPNTVAISFHIDPDKLDELGDSINGFTGACLHAVIPEMDAESAISCAAELKDMAFDQYVYSNSYSGANITAYGAKDYNGQALLIYTIE